MGGEDDLRVKALARHYGASPLHLIAHVIVFALAGWAIVQLVDIRDAIGVVTWFVAALILHDLVLLPAYTALDQLDRRARLRGIPLANFIRVPAILSGLTFLVFFPLILGKSDNNLRYVSGITPSGYLGRWLALVAAVWLVSAAVLAVRLVRADPLHRRAPSAGDGDRAGG
jgi:hypothetical protein